MTGKAYRVTAGVVCDSRAMLDISPYASPSWSRRHSSRFLRYAWMASFLISFKVRTLASVFSGSVSAITRS